MGPLFVLLLTPYLVTAKSQNHISDPSSFFYYGTGSEPASQITTTLA